MDAQLKKITVTPAKFDEDGVSIKSSEFATLTLDVPLDSTAQREAIVELMTLLDSEWVETEIQSRQQRMKMAG
ncbi:hypothetical protein F4Z98_04960 [Candidatus Poribacteria bacterium]|nr:hypothetical protein [Candidatus Poribacteria bacterium]MXV82705.1 hypothetical protein [Candidatus Poribacteria bacterium]MYC39541.1 hypothetical protein [Candidatus Dadabacteria bacterium]